MDKIFQGLYQFRSQAVSCHRDLFKTLSHCQTPVALFITCSDSRLNPNLITQTEPGELFVLRNAGAIVPPYGQGDGGEAASIEYALRVLKVQDVVICGHSHCGAMSAVAHNTPLAGLPALEKWLSYSRDTQATVDRHYTDLCGAQRVTATIQENVLLQIENLGTHPAVAEAVERAALTLHGWVYEIETGEVFTFDPLSQQFLPLSGAHPLFPRAVA